MRIPTSSPRAGDLENRRCWIGIDAGSVAVKLAVLGEDRSVLQDTYLRHEGQPLAAAARLFEGLDQSGLRVQQIAGLRATGSGGKVLAHTIKQYMKSRTSG